jgi:hypothetical protein
MKTSPVEKLTSARGMARPPSVKGIAAMRPALAEDEALDQPQVAGRVREADRAIVSKIASGGYSPGVPRTSSGLSPLR